MAKEQKINKNEDNIETSNNEKQDVKETSNNEIEDKYIALVNIKYNKDIYKIGDYIKVSKKDLQEMLNRNLIELK